MTIKGLRTKTLESAARSYAAFWAARRKAAQHGVTLSRDGDAVVLRKGDRRVKLLSKHIFFVSLVSAHFHDFAHGLPPSGTFEADYAARPDDFNMLRHCLNVGVVVEHRGDKVWLHKGDRAMILSTRLYVYSLNMAENFDIYFSPLVPAVLDGKRVVDFSVPGTLQTYAGSGLQFELASFPEEEDAIQEYFKWYRPQPGDVVYDIGAHCGVSTHHLAQLVGPEGKVIAFEPDPTNFELLRHNMDRHGLRQVTLVQAALASEAGTLHFNAEGTIGSALVSLLQRETVGQIVSVQALRLSDAFAQWGVPAFCKIDIEGAEVDVLREACETLRTHPVHLALDTHHPRADGSMTNRDVETILRTCGYEAMSEAKPLWTTWGRPQTGA